MISLKHEKCEHGLSHCKKCCARCAGNKNV